MVKATAKASLLAAFLLISISVQAAAPLPRIAIIIDDLGYKRAAGERALRLPGAVTFAILPGAPWTPKLAALAQEQGKEVLLHLPLQAASDELGAESGSLEIDMSREQFGLAVAVSIDAVPNIAGINTHRGSLLTRHPGHMGWLMDEILARGNLFFVDSFTTHQSVALQIAQESGVPAIRRDVFLDPDSEPDTLSREFARLQQIARERGSAVGIGHPYPATLEFLERMLPDLSREGIELVPVSRLIVAE